MLKKFNWIQQHDLKDCGPACLAMISRHYGLSISISKVREIAGTDLQGLIMEKENLKRESESINKQKIKDDVSEEEKEILNDKVLLLEAQKNSIGKRIEQRKIVLENKRKLKQLKKENKKKRNIN